MEYKDVGKAIKFRDEKSATQNFGPLYLFIHVEHPAKTPGIFVQYGYSIRKRDDSDEYSIHYGMQAIKKVGGRQVVIESNSRVKRSSLERKVKGVNLKDLESIRTAVIDSFRGVSGVEISLIRAL